MGSSAGALFEGLVQREARVRGEVVPLPIRYRDGSFVTAVFAARRGAVERELARTGLRAVSAGPGLALVAVTVFEYRDSDIGAYGELAVSILAVPPPRSAGVAGLLAAVRRRELDAFVWHLPVTTELACAAGVELWGFPKVVLPVGLRREAGHVVGELRVEGRAVLSLSGPAREGRRRERLTIHAYATRGGAVVEGRVELEAEGIRWSLAPRGVRLALDRSDVLTRGLGAALVTERPLAYAWAPRFRSVLHGPVEVG